MERETRIKEFMSKYGLNKLPLYCDGGRYVGYLDENLSYTKGHFYYLKDRNIELLVAVDMLPIIENIIKIWNKPISVNVLKCVDYKKSAVEEWKGTFDEVCEKLYVLNNKLRYCNGDYYQFEDKDMQSNFRIWYDLIPSARSFAIYYGNGIVD